MNIPPPPAAFVRFETERNEEIRILKAAIVSIGPSLTKGAIDQPTFEVTTIQLSGGHSWAVKGTIGEVYEKMMGWGL